MRARDAIGARDYCCIFLANMGREGGEAVKPAPFWTWIVSTLELIVKGLCDKFEEML
jgi:hypothetical protein